jgi:hypothetical protein
MGLNDNRIRTLLNESRILVISAALLCLFQGCKVHYSFSGASISPNTKTVSVTYFQNRASLVQPGLSQQLTDALIDKIKSQTSLKVVTGVGDVNFEGQITDYSTKPLTVGADAKAATNRFTITVQVKFTNSVDPNYSFDQSFSEYQDYNSNLDLSSVEADLSQKIIDLLVEDIFNKAFVNW